jgi:hypothetical protein
MDWRCGSSSRASAYETLSSNSSPTKKRKRSQKKKKKSENKSASKDVEKLEWL